MNLYRVVRLACWLGCAAVLWGCARGTAHPPGEVADVSVGTMLPASDPPTKAPPPPAIEDVFAMIEAGDVAGAMAALDAGVSPEAEDRHGTTLFFESIYEREPDIAKLLLDRGVDPNATRGEGANQQSAAHVGTMGGMTDTLRLLAERGAVLDAPSAAAAGEADRLAELLDADPSLMNQTWYFHPNSGERTLLALAALYGAVPSIQLLIERGADPREPQGDDFTALHMAAGWGRLEATRELLEHDPRPNRASEYGWTPMIVAASAGHDDVFELLLAHGGDYGLMAAAMRGDTQRLEELLADADLEVDAETGGSTPLMAAAARGHTEAVAMLIDAGANMEFVNDWEGSALARAAWSGHVDTVRLLLERGCDPDVGDSEDAYGRALHRAAWHGRLEIMTLLLDHGANIESVDNTRESALFFAVKQGQLEAAALLLDRGANVNATSEYGSTPLQSAAWHGHVAMAKLLLDHGANVNARTRHDGTPLHAAAKRGYFDLVELFLEHPVDMNILDVDQKTPLHFAVEPKRDPKRQADAYKIFDRLLAHGYHLEARSRAGYTVLHRAVHHGAAPDMMAHVLNAGALLEADTAKGYTALHLACFSRNAILVAALLEHGASVNVRDKEGRMPLHIVVNDTSERSRQIVAMLTKEGVEIDIYAAAQLGELDRVRELLRGDPTRLNEPGGGGRTLIQIAGWRGDLAMVEFLLDHDPPAEVDATGPGWHGWSALHSAAAGGHAEVAQRLLEAGADPNQRAGYGQSIIYSASMKGAPAVIRMLIDAGADVNVRTAYSRTPLMEAAENGYTQVVEMLLDAGAVIDAETKSGETALGQAVSRADVDTVALLLERGADVNLAGDDYSPALHDAASRGTPEMVKLLLEAGAEVNRLNERNDTAMDWALSNGKREAAAVLKEAGGKRGHEVLVEAEAAWEEPVPDEVGPGEPVAP